MVDNKYTRAIAHRHIDRATFEGMPADLQAHILAAIEQAYQDGYEDGLNSANEAA